MKWAVLGTGVIANEMAQALEKMGEHLYAVGNRTYTKAVAFAEKYQVEKVYDDFHEMFTDPKTDIIYITTPHNTHIQFVREALKNKKHVLCEKSITLNSAELEEANQLAKENGVIFAEAMTIYHMPIYKKLKEQIPNISITTDIIVGFPGETNKQFEDTLSLVEECKFDLAYTFIFSKRVGTPAYNMKDEVTKEEKEERLQRLNELINKYALINNKKLINKEENVLVEGFSSKNSDLLMGYTETNKLVNFKGDSSLIGKIVKVKILDAKTWSLDGEYVK